MGKAEEVKRTYQGSDDDMLQAGRIMQAIFVEDKLAFANFDAAYNDPFGANWLQKITDGGNVNPDSVVVNAQAELTVRVEAKMGEANSFFQSMKYFIEKAFPGKKEMYAQFGYNDYEDARKSQIKMIRFLAVLYKTASANSAQLIAAGFGQEKIAQILTLHDELTNLDNEQEVVKRKRPLSTHDRIVQMNECYAIMQQVSKAGKIIFASNRAKYDQYLLPNERTQKKSEDEQTPPEQPEGN